MSKPSVLIIGGGVFGTSTAYHLSLRGYDNVTVVDRFDAPSKDSAATDLNKIIRTDYPNPLYAKLGLEAMCVWKDPKSLFSGMYRETGWVMGAHALARGWLQSVLEMARKTNRDGVVYMSADELKAEWPALTGDFPDWTNLYSPAAGWVPSAKALLQMATAAQGNGVEYIVGEAGHIKELWYDEDGSCRGAIAANGKVHQADLVVVAAGANLPALVDGAKSDVVAKTSAICVIQLESHEIEEYRDIPIIDNFEKGIIFPPDENGLIKICSARLISNFKNHSVSGASILHSVGDHPYDGCPRELEEEMRQLIREAIPELADRPFVTTRLCWDGMATDLNFRICPFPETKNLFIATAGSNHGFKFLPVIGQYVADMLEGKLGPEWVELWKWKYGKIPANFQNAYPWPVRDLSELTGWKGRNVPGAGKLPWTWSRL
ncbi:FAD dependent oxidoreductase [Ilyonectria destructans]|nr:FAD dependent oxidoreductase [Ilyonectria destructans]